MTDAHPPSNLVVQLREAVRLNCGELTLTLPSGVAGPRQAICTIAPGLILQAADEIERLNKSERDIAEQMARLLATSKTGGSDCCITCAAHVLMIGDKDAEIERLRAALAGEIGLVQLFTTRSLFQSDRQTVLANHRHVEALAALGDWTPPDETSGGT